MNLKHIYLRWQRYKTAKLEIDNNLSTYQEYSALFLNKLKAIFEDTLPSLTGAFRCLFIFSLKEKQAHCNQQTSSGKTDTLILLKFEPKFFKVSEVRAYRTK